MSIAKSIKAKEMKENGLDKDMKKIRDYPKDESKFFCKF